MKQKTKPTTKPPMYICQTCSEEKKEVDFFKSLYTQLWVNSDKRVLFCKDCINTLFLNHSKRYSEKTATMICCAILDIPFSSTLYESVAQKNSVFNMGLYVRLMNGTQYRDKTFASSIVDGELSKTEREVKEEVESSWSKSDKQNMKFAISVVGYDPFDNCGMTDDDRKYCFNILASYCNSEGIQEDGHKIQSVVQMTQSQLQCRKIDENINAELLTVTPQDTRVRELTQTKKRLLDSISTMAKDNNISSAHNVSSKQGVNTLSYKTNKILQDGFEDIQVNLFDIKTSEAMKQVADLSNRSILEQLTFDANEYSEMLKEQRALLLETIKERDVLAEENRKLKNEAIEKKINRNRSD